MAPRATIAPPVATAGHGDECDPADLSVTRTGPAATCGLDAGVVGEDVVVDAAPLAMDDGVDVVEATELTAVNGDTCSDVVDAASTDVEVEGALGAHVEAASGDPFGGGSLGLPAPCGWNRQPSTTSEWIRDPPGPTFE